VALHWLTKLLKLQHGPFLIFPKFNEPGLLQICASLPLLTGMQYFQHRLPFAKNAQIFALVILGVLLFIKFTGFFNLFPHYKSRFDQINHKIFKKLILLSIL